MSALSDGVVGALERELLEIGQVAPQLASSTLAAAALALARELDDPQNSATSKSMCARALTETMDRIRALMPAREENDDLDELRARRARRTGGAAT